VKRYLNDWCITKEVALDRREWKLAIHVLEPFGSVLLFPFVKFFFLLLFHFFDLAFYYLFSFFDLVFLSSFIFPLFLLLFYTFFAHVISSLAYANLFGNKRLVVVIVESWFLYSWTFSSCRGDWRHGGAANRRSFLY
jgi:hypothetical protein